MSKLVDLVILLTCKRPIMALIAGVQAPSSRVMGHAGALLRAGEKSAKAKITAFEKAGVTIVNHPSKFGEGMKRRFQDGDHGTSQVNVPSSSLRVWTNLYFDFKETWEFNTETEFSCDAKSESVS